MIYNEEHRDLFSVNFIEWTPAHCISRDCKMGAGIAVPMKKKFKLGGLKDTIDNFNVALPYGISTCIFHNEVLNLITKKRYWHKPTYESIGTALTAMLVLANTRGIKKIVMPKIGCGLDGLNWSRVREIIKEVFKDTDIEILVCIQ